MQVIARTAPATPAATAAAPDGNGASAASNGSSAAGTHAGSGVAAFLDATRDMLESVHVHRAVLVAQIDGFAKVQDELGPRGGDEISSNVQRTLEEQLDRRPCARLSTHQFAFAITDADRSSVLERVESLRKAVEGLMTEVRGRTVRVTISIGGTELDEEQEGSGEALIEAALNTAFASARRAEQAGGNRVELLTKEVAREEPDSEAGQILAQINERQPAFSAAVPADHQPARRFRRALRGVFAHGQQRRPQGIAQ